MVITLVASVMPPEMAVVQIINKKFTTAGIYALIIAILCLVKMDGEPLMDFAKVSQVGVRWELCIRDSPGSGQRGLSVDRSRFNRCLFYQFG